MFITCPDLNIVVSVGIGKLEGREGDGGTASPWSSQNTHNIDHLSSLSYMGVGCGTPKAITVVTSEITDHRSP